MPSLFIVRRKESGEIVFNFGSAQQDFTASNQLRYIKAWDITILFKQI